MVSWNQTIHKLGQYKAKSCAIIFRHGVRTRESYKSRKKEKAALVKAKEFLMTIKNETTSSSKMYSIEQKRGY